MARELWMARRGNQGVWGSRVEHAWVAGFFFFLVLFSTGKEFSWYNFPASLYPLLLPCGIANSYLPGESERRKVGISLQMPGHQHNVGRPDSWGWRSIPGFTIWKPLIVKHLKLIVKDADSQ